MYRMGKDVAKDEAQSMIWYLMAAEQGHAASQFSLGFFYENGKGVEKNESEALSWYSKAAAQGYAGASQGIERLRAKTSSSLVAPPKVASPIKQIIAASESAPSAAAAASTSIDEVAVLTEFEILTQKAGQQDVRAQYDLGTVNKVAAFQELKAF